MALLQVAMETEGNLYVCPGLDTGDLDIPAETFVAITGAGMGDDPRSQTMLEAQASGRVVSIGETAIAHLRALRIRKGVACNGSGVVAESEASLELAPCAVVENGNDTTARSPVRWSAAAGSGLQQPASAGGQAAACPPGAACDQGLALLRHADHVGRNFNVPRRLDELHHRCPAYWHVVAIQVWTDRAHPGQVKQRRAVVTSAGGNIATRATRNALVRRAN